jgi:AraC-like DNA-binding protein
MGRAAPDVLLLSHNTRGSLTVRTNGRAVTAEAGSLVVVDPGRLTTMMNPVDVSQRVLQIPAEALGLSQAQREALSASPMGPGECIGGLLGYIVNDLVRHSGEHPPALVAQLTSMVIDLLGTAARMALATGSMTGTGMPEATRLLQIYTFMQQRLADPALTPELVAAAHAISVRQLNRILEADGQSPAEWIRRQRLDRCRRDLTDPTLAERPVAMVGSRWGFTDPATFNRAFRREFGMPPGEYRRRFGPDPRRDAR